MEGKRVSDSMTILSVVMTQQDANVAGNVHGGAIMKLIDTAGGVVAIRHARVNAVTASIDRLNFHYPVYIGNLVTLKASINLVGRTSMEIGVRVEAEDLYTGQVKHTASAYLTFVALDKAGRPVPLPPLILETEEEKRRNRQAQVRRENRLRERNSES